MFPTIFKLQFKFLFDSFLPEILLNVSMHSKINLLSSDEKIFKEDLDVVKKSITIRTMTEDLGVENNETEDEVKEVLPLPNIDSEVLELILQWCRHHKDDPDPEKEDADSRYGRDSNDKKI